MKLKHVRCVVRSSYSVREIAETIPEFNPSDNMSLSAEQIVNRVNVAVAAYKWEEKRLMPAIYGKLKGSAKLWIESWVEFYSDWHHFATKLIKAFGVRLDEAKVHRKMTTTCRGKDLDISFG